MRILVNDIEQIIQITLKIYRYCLCGPPSASNQASASVAQGRRLDGVLEVTCRESQIASITRCNDSRSCRGGPIGAETFECAAVDVSQQRSLERSERDMRRNTIDIGPLKGTSGQFHGATVRRGPIEEHLSADEIILEIATIDMR